MWEKVWSILLVVALLFPLHYVMNRIFWLPEDSSAQESRRARVRVVVITLIDAVSDYFKYWI